MVTESLNDLPITTSIDFGRKGGDFTVMGQWSRDTDGGYTLRSIRQYRTYPIRSKAQVKRLLKRFECYSPVMDLIHCRGVKSGRKIRPVSWQEIAAHNIKVML